jgi:hypothetical protein
MLEVALTCRMQHLGKACAQRHCGHDTRRIDRARNSAAGQDQEGRALV